MSNCEIKKEIADALRRWASEAPTAESIWDIARRLADILDQPGFKASPTGSTVPIGPGDTILLSGVRKKVAAVCPDGFANGRWFDTDGWCHSPEGCVRFGPPVEIRVLDLVVDLVEGPRQYGYVSKIENGMYYCMFPMPKESCYSCWPRTRDKIVLAVCPEDGR